MNASPLALVTVGRPATIEVRPIHAVQPPPRGARPMPADNATTAGAMGVAKVMSRPNATLPTSGSPLLASVGADGGGSSV